jgi:hypothetical protein
MNKIITPVLILGCSMLATSVLAAKSANDSTLSNSICLQNYAKMQAQAKKDEITIKKKSEALKANKSPNAYKSFLKEVSSALKNEFAYMKDQKVLNTCLTAAKSKNTDAYIPLMKSYMANQKTKEAQLWCNKAAKLGLKGDKGNAITSSVCGAIGPGIAFIYGKKA